MKYYMTALLVQSYRRSDKIFKPITDYFLANIDLKNIVHFGRPRPVKAGKSEITDLIFIQHSKRIH